jgi:hypothetical protein
VGREGEGEGEGDTLSRGLGADVNDFIALDANVCGYPVEPELEGAVHTEKAGKENIESGEEVLTGLGLG